MRLDITQDEQSSRISRYRDELLSVLTIAECAAIWEISPRTVEKDVREGNLYAEKRNQSEFNERAGIWLIPYSAAKEFYQPRRKGKSS